MWDQINRLIELAVGPVRRLASELRGILNAVASTITMVMTNVATRWNGLAQAALWWRWAIQRYVSETYTTLRWLLLVQLPRVARQYADAAQRLVLSMLVAAEARLRGLVDAVTRWAQGQLNRVLSLLDNLTRWARQQLTNVFDFIAWLSREVLPRVTSPTRMAEWLAGAIVIPILRVLDAHAEAVAEWVLRNSVRTILRSLPRIERFVARMF